MPAEDQNASASKNGGRANTPKKSVRKVKAGAKAEAEAKLVEEVVDNTKVCEEGPWDPDKISLVVGYLTENQERYDDLKINLKKHCTKVKTDSQVKICLTHQHTDLNRIAW